LPHRAFLLASQVRHLATRPRNPASTFTISGVFKTSYSNLRLFPGLHLRPICQKIKHLIIPLKRQVRRITNQQPHVFQRSKWGHIYAEEFLSTAKSPPPQKKNLAPWVGFLGDNPESPFSNVGWIFSVSWQIHAQFSPHQLKKGGPARSSFPLKRPSAAPLKGGRKHFFLKKMLFYPPLNASKWLHMA
jgi:hypothetical protein